jgi:hypothetical protein
MSCSPARDCRADSLSSCRGGSGAVRRLAGTGNTAARRVCDHGPQTCAALEPHADRQLTSQGANGWRARSMASACVACKLVEALHSHLLGTHRLAARRCVALRAGAGSGSRGWWCLAERNPQLRGHGLTEARLGGGIGPQRRRRFRSRRPQHRARQGTRRGRSGRSAGRRITRLCGRRTTRHQRRSNRRSACHADRPKLRAAKPRRHDRLLTCCVGNRVPSCHSLSWYVRRDCRRARARAVGRCPGDFSRP